MDQQYKDLESAAKASNLEKNWQDFKHQILKSRAQVQEYALVYTLVRLGFETTDEIINYLKEGLITKTEGPTKISFWFNGNFAPQLLFEIEETEVGHFVTFPKELPDIVEPVMEEPKVEKTIDYRELQRLAARADRYEEMIKHIEKILEEGGMADYRVSLDGRNIPFEDKEVMLRTHLEQLHDDLGELRKKIIALT